MGRDWSVGHSVLGMSRIDVIVVPVPNHQTNWTTACRSIQWGVYESDGSTTYPRSLTGGTTSGRYKIRGPVERAPTYFSLNWRRWIGNGVKTSGSQATVVVVNTS